MEVAGIIIQCVLALIAVIIAYYQMRGEKRRAKEDEIEKRNQAEEKAMLETILSSAEEAYKCVDTIRGFYKTINDLAQFDNNDPGKVILVVDKAIEDYERSFNNARESLNRLYNALLVNEERFPMAYGFGRYIKDLRYILDYDALLRERRRCGYDGNRIKYYKLHKYCFNAPAEQRKPALLELGAIMEEIIAKNLEPYYNHADTIQSVLYELTTKYKSRYPKGDKAA